MPRFSANITFLFRELPLLQRFQAARDAGFQAVEILMTEGASTADLSAAARKSGLQVVLCNAPGGDFFEGGAGLSAVPGREQEFRLAVLEVRDLATALQCPTVHLGPSRIPPGVSRQSCMQVYRENLEFAAQTLAESGITATLEALNPHDNPGIFLDSIELALQMLDQLDLPSLKLQFDVYHVVRSGGDYLKLLDQHMGRIAHLQFADVPGRGEPGSGEVDFAAVFALLDSLAYSGWAGAEYRPTGTTQDSLDWFQSFRQ